MNPLRHCIWNAHSSNTSCYHIRPSLSCSVSYALGVSIAFVGSLYIFVPFHVRQLHRNHARQIQWRTMASGVAAVCAHVAYVALFYCHGTYCEQMTVIKYDRDGHKLVTPIVIGHTLALYFGPMCQTTLENLIVLKSESSTGRPRFSDFVRVLYRLYVAPSVSAVVCGPPSRRWMVLRNYIIAPTLEEIVFRGCIVPALYSTGAFSILQTSLLAPLCFGVAHLHHAGQLVQQGVGMTRIVLSTVFQFAYTYVFGIYTSYVYLMGNSLTAVIASHMICNWMGLPDLTFSKFSSPNYSYRHALWTAHWLGIIAFAFGFRYLT